MKFPEHKLFMETVRLPSPVQKWFGHQLELRGIDSIIYSRHIIHLLQQDDDEFQDYVDLDLLFDPKADKKHQCKPARYDKKKLKNSEERKKSAAIECLQAVSDEDNGIENLVEELCHKLKALEQHDGGDGTNSQEQTTSSSESDSSSSELEDPAERYYAAFPALHGKDQHTTPDDSQSVWKNNPITKPKPSQTDEGLNQKDQAPENQHREQIPSQTQSKKKKKQTVRKIHMRKTPSRKEDTNHGVCRFLSLPNGSLNIEKPNTQAHSLQDKELCSQVECMLKEILLQKEEQALKQKMPCPEEKIRKPTNAEGAEIAAGISSPRDTDGSVSPELQEDDSWYTQPIDILFTTEEPRQRLYKRNNSSSASPLQQKSGSDSPVSPDGGLMQQSFVDDTFFFPYSTSNSSETGFSNTFPAHLSHSMFNQSEPEAIPNPDTVLNPEECGFPIFSPYDNLPQTTPTSEKGESLIDRCLTDSCIENMPNSVSLTTISDLEDLQKGMEDLDLDESLASSENLLDHQQFDQIMNTANHQEVNCWNNNLQNFDSFLPSNVASTWPSKVLVDDLMPDVHWDERNEDYTADFYNHLKYGKIWQVWDVNYQKITGTYSGPLKNPLHTCWSDCGLFGMSSCWDPCQPGEQSDVWGSYGLYPNSSTWGDYWKLKDSYGKDFIKEDLSLVETSEDVNLLEDPCNPLVMVDVDQDSVVCQLENQNSELIPQIQFDLVSEVGSEYDNVLSDGENDQLSNSEDDQCFSRNLSYGDFQTMWSMAEHSTPKKFHLSRSFELVPSEGSAFVDVVPKKIHHVLSEPILVSQEMESLTTSSSCKKRSCKSDSSSPEEHLYFSQKTHFQPIQSPVVQNTGSTYNLRDLFGGYAPSKTPYQKFQTTTDDEGDEDEETFVPMFKIRKDQDKYIQTSSSLDSDDEKELKEGSERNNGLFGNDGEVFDLFGYVENLTESAESTPRNLLECVNNCVDSGYEDLDQHVQEKDEADRAGFYRGPTMNKKGDPWSMEYGFYPKQNMCSCGELAKEENWLSNVCRDLSTGNSLLDYSKQNVCSCGKTPVVRDGETDTRRDAAVSKPPVHQWVIQEAWGLDPGSEGQQEAALSHSIWSSGHEDGAFSEMFYYPGHDEESAAEQYKLDDSSASKLKDPSEENENTLFDFNQDMVHEEKESKYTIGKMKETGQSNSYIADSDPYGQSFMEMTSYFGDDVSDTSKARPDQQCAGQLDKENHPPENDSDIVKVKLVIKKGKKKQDFENLDTNPPLFMPMPVAAVYSCELEHAWMNNMEVECLFPQSLNGKGKKKPCTFFLEGNCRRTDCKFAHDLSHITCRFWEEGDCFKGELCPFLHGYSPYARKSNHHASERRDLKPFKYQAEDFPNLTKTESKGDRSKKDKYNKLNKYKASKTQLKTQINKKLQKNNVVQEEAENLPKKLKQKGSQ
ncbi:uncharacterized protein LOC134229745 isoform X1 [Saccostrea cucullata]|uniref:uncharacterized protein LOC134229745 isoform X1 n=1 Tax=Saccostrea cuccullata TaxID=36930 RepID=UPI002ED3B691